MTDLLAEICTKYRIRTHNGDGTERNASQIIADMYFNLDKKSIIDFMTNIMWYETKGVDIFNESKS